MYIKYVMNQEDLRQNIKICAQNVGQIIVNVGNKFNDNYKNEFFI